MCSADPFGSATNFQGIREYISVMAALKFAYFLYSRNKVLFKMVAELL